MIVYLCTGHMYQYLLISFDSIFILAGYFTTIMILQKLHVVNLNPSDQILPYRALADGQLFSKAISLTASFNIDASLNRVGAKSTEKRLFLIQKLKVSKEING